MNRIPKYLFDIFAAGLCAGAACAQPPANPEPEAEEAPITVAREHRGPQRGGFRSGHDQVMFWGDLVVKAGQEIADGVVIGGTATIDGTVNNDLVVVLGHAKLGAEADVKGDLVVVAGSADIDPAAHVGGERFILGSNSPQFVPGFLGWPRDWVLKGLLWGRPLPYQVAWSWAIAGIFLVFYLLTALLFPRSVQASVEVLSNRPGTSFIFGLLAMLLAGPLVMLLIITVVGMILIPFVGTGLVVAFLFGKVAVYRYAGQQFGGQLHLEPLRHPLLALLAGTLLFYLVYTIPILGLVLWCLVAPLGLGAVLLAFFRRLRTERPPRPVAEPALVPPLAPVAGIGEPPMPAEVNSMNLARAGFWVRLAATLLDFILILMVTRLVHLHGLSFFVILWAAYHVAFWAWKGTTIGGIVCGLKVIRTEGKPIDFAVALVRCLAAFLSFAALGLGFFWAGWSAEKQSWHDKIAGTCLVKVPKSVSLV
jgi:uncharacterized RDD family membrane protein YckC